jgi:hypothetical protein
MSGLHLRDRVSLYQPHIEIDPCIEIQLCLPPTAVHFGEFLVRLVELKS